MDLLWPGQPMLAKKDLQQVTKVLLFCRLLRKENMDDAEIAKWEALPQKDKEKELYKLDNPVPELVINQEMRQRAFERLRNYR